MSKDPHDQCLAVKLSTRCLLATVVVSTLQVGRGARADITVDPRGVGADSVTPIYEGADPWVVEGGEVFIGSSGAGELLVNGGSHLLADYIYIEDYNGGQLAVDGVGSLVEVQQQYLSIRGWGEPVGLSITGGGKAIINNISVHSNVDGDAQILVSGEGSALQVEYDLNFWGGTSLVIEDGGLVDLGGGDWGQGRMLMTASLSSLGIPGVQIKGDNSRLLIGGELGMGGESGFVIVEDGGYLETGGALIAVDASGYTSVHVRGDDSLWYSKGGIVVDEYSLGSGSIVVEDGGQVVVDGDIQLSSRGLYRDSIGQASFVLGDGGRLGLNGNSINFQDYDDARRTFMMSGGRLEDVGRINTRYWDNVFVQDGGVFVVGGYQEGHYYNGYDTKIEGGYEMRENALLEFQLINRWGRFNLNKLYVSEHVKLDGGFVLAPWMWVEGEGNESYLSNLVDLEDFSRSLYYGREFELIDARTIEGYFKYIEGVELTDEYSLAVIYDEYGVSAVVARPGDANLDGQVTLLDLDILGRHYGSAGTWALGDFNGDGVVSLLDLDILGRHYRGGYDAFLRDYENSLVPEPASLGFLMLAGLVMRRRR